MAGEKRVVIIGGGISGLAAAHRLRELDPSIRVRLLESSDRIGGVIRSEHDHGCCIEHGPDSLVTTVPWGLDLCRRIGLEESLVPANSQHHGVYVVCRGRLRRMPDGLVLMAPKRLWPVIASPILSLRGKLRLACECIVPRRTQITDESLKQFVMRRLGTEAFERLVQPLVSGIYMGSPDCLSAAATFPQFVEMETKFGSLMRGMWAQQARLKAQGPSARQKPTITPAAMFVAPREGMEQLPKAIAAQLPPDVIQLHCRVQELSRQRDGQWHVKSAQGHEQPANETYDAVIIATSAHAAARLLFDSAPSLAGELAAIEHGSCVVVNVSFVRNQIKQPLDAHGFVVPLVEGRAVSACTFSSVKYPHRAPRETCLMRAFLGGAASPEALHWPDSQIKHVVLDELDGLLGISGEPLLFKVTRSRRVMPQYELGHLERLERIERIIQCLPGLKLAGNAYHGVGIAHCIHSGELAAEQVYERLAARQHLLHQELAA